MPEADGAVCPERDYALAEAAVREAGTLGHAYYETTPHSWNKDDSSPVSIADHAIDGLLRRRLEGHRPSYGWLSEESVDDPSRLTRERVWIVDPIDGTRAYLAGRPDWVVSVALARAGHPEFGFLYNPLRGEFLAARRGAGATMNGQPIRVAGRDTLDGARMLAGQSRFAAHRWRTPWPAMEISRISSFAYQIALVATGRADATIAFTRIHEWDLAAAEIILAEAGGVLTTPAGDPIRYNALEPRRPGAVAANPRLHAAVIDFIAANGQNEDGTPAG